MTDEGMTLIEVLVAMGLFGVLSTLLLGLAISTQAVTQQTRDRTNVSEEARTAMERITREVRQAASIDEVVLPIAPATTGVTCFTFWTDFNGDGARTTSASDPEVLTYRWVPATQRVSLTSGATCATAATTDNTRPLLAAKVTSFAIEPRSSRWEYDQPSGTPPTPDGKTTWLELDQAGPPVGNSNSLPDPIELKLVDLLYVRMTVEDGDGTQTYTTQIDLRNRR